MRGTLLIKNATVIAADRLLEKRHVLCTNGKIEKIISESSQICADETVDVQGQYLAPGFIDLHIHGTNNLLIERNREDLEELCRRLPRYGVTGFLPTICPMPSAEDDIKLLESLSQVKSAGTHILGFFLEGHYVALTGAISHLPKDISKERVERIIKAAEPYVPVFAISPEFAGIFELLPLMTRKGYPAFITHTMATVKETEAAIRHGAVHATHFYDVFPYPGEKDPGVRTCGTVEAILASRETSVDFVLDGEHVDPVAVKMALACKAKDQVSLITDANINAGLPKGSYKGLGGSDIEVAYEGGPARLGANSTMPGALAGSGLTMDRAVRNAVKLLDVDLPQAVAMASYNPAKVLGLHDRKGCMCEGYDADMVLLNRDLEVTKSWVGGKCVYTR